MPKMNGENHDTGRTGGVPTVGSVIGSKRFTHIRLVARCASKSFTIVRPGGVFTYAGWRLGIAQYSDQVQGFGDLRRHAQ